MDEKFQQATPEQSESAYSPLFNPRAAHTMLAQIIVQRRKSTDQLEAFLESLPGQLSEQATAGLCNLLLNASLR